jgi:hypothetical protein
MTTETVHKEIKKAIFKFILIYRFALLMFIFSVF